MMKQQGSMMRSMVGSRPPSCAGRCWWCGGRRCVAVQVPITPQDKTSSHGFGGSRPTSGRGASAAPQQQQQQQKKQHHHQQQEVSSYDDHSNYKPLSWRCKCGGGGGGLNP
ncbi:unnamed protein product [Urochloa humidicola]